MITQLIYIGVSLLVAKAVARQAAIAAARSRHRQARSLASVLTDEAKFLRLRAKQAADLAAGLRFRAQQRAEAAQLLTTATPISPPSGPVTGFFNGSHPKSKFLGDGARLMAVPLDSYFRNTQETDKAWIEILYRNDGVPWTGLHGVHPDSYRLRGGAMPVAEFTYLCDVFDMLRDGVPVGSRHWFERPMRSLDVLMLCQMKPGIDDPSCTPSLVVNARDMRRFCMAPSDDKAQLPSRMPCCDDHFMIQLPPSFVWHSRIKESSGKSKPTRRDGDNPDGWNECSL